MKNLKRRLAIASTFFVLVIIAVAVWAFWPKWVEGPNGDESSPTATDEATEVATDDELSCPAEFVQNEHSRNNDPNDTRIVDGLDLEVLQILQEASTLPLADQPEFVSDEVWAIMLDNVGFNHKTMVEAALAFGALESGDNTTEKNAELVTEDGTCLSEKGQELHRVLMIVMKHHVESVTIEEAPQGLCNSGWNGGKVVVAATCGITGNREAVVFNLKDGSRIFVLTRCGNWTFSPNGELVHKLPPGETDNPKGSANPESQHDFWGDTSGGGGETVAPTGPTTSNDGGTTWQPARPANPSTTPGSVAPPTVQAPSTGGTTSENNDLTKPVPPTGGVTVDKGTSGTTSSGGTTTVPDAGSDNTEIVAPPD